VKQAFSVVFLNASSTSNISGVSEIIVIAGLFTIDIAAPVLIR
jgi:hypothetical protein